MSAPKCLNCGTAIRKKTETVFFSHDAADAPADLAGCKKLTNLEVVSVRYWHTGRARHFSTWDGTSYAANYGHFCKNECAGMFAYKLANRGARL